MTSSKQLENAFWNVIESQRSYEYGLKTNIKKSIMLFLPSVENLDKKRQQLFLDHYYDLLLKLKWFLLAERSKNPDFQSLHDKLFQKTFQIKSNAPLKITRIFEKFLKSEVNKSFVFPRMAEN